MELTRFHQCVDDEFGHDYGTWILRSHVLSEYGKTPDELLASCLKPKRMFEKSGGHCVAILTYRRSAGWGLICRFSKTLGSNLIIEHLCMYGERKRSMSAVGHRLLNQEPRRNFSHTYEVCGTSWWGFQSKL